MRNRIEDYTDNDLRIRRLCEWNTGELNSQLDAELIKRQYNVEFLIQDLQPLTAS
jgi:hypothetical protein